MSQHPVAAEPDGSHAALRRDHVWAAALTAVVVLGYVLIAALHGALGAARNDDWAYYRSAFEFAESGHFQPDPYTLAMLVGQVVIADPLVHLFGPSIGALQVLVSILGGLGLLASYSVLRSFLPHGWALFSVGCLALGPIYGSITVTFMTDVPCFAFQALCLLAGLRALRTRPVSPGWLVTSLALGLVSFTIRDYGVAAPVAVLALCLLRTRGAGTAAWWRLVGLSAAYLLALAGLDLWRRGLVASPSSPTFVLPDRYTVARIARAYFTTALLVCPALVLYVPRRLLAILRRGALLPAAVAVGVAGVAVLVKRHDPLLILNYVTPAGSYPETLGNGRAVVPHVLWVALQLLALLSAVVLSVVAADEVRNLRRSLPTITMRSPEVDGARLAAAFVAVSLATIAAVHLLTGGPLFDRYLLPVVPFLAGLVALSARARRRERPAYRAAVSALALLGILGLALVDASATFDGAKWDLSRAVAGEGYSPSTIDGGLEWFGFHQPEPIESPHPAPLGEPFYWGLFRHPDVCVTVSLPDAAGRHRGSGPPVASLTARTVFGLRYSLEARRTPSTCSAEH